MFHMGVLLNIQCCQLPFLQFVKNKWNAEAMEMLGCDASCYNFSQIVGQIIFFHPNTSQSLYFFVPPQAKNKKAAKHAAARWVKLFKVLPKKF